MNEVLSNKNNGVGVLVMVIFTEIIIMISLFLIITHADTVIAQTHDMGTQNNSINYIRLRVPDIPKNLVTFERKLEIINSLVPKADSIAIICSGNQYGNLAYIAEVVENDIIIIEEFDEVKNCVVRRKGTPEQLKIVGFFYPQNIIERKVNYEKIYSH